MRHTEYDPWWDNGIGSISNRQSTLSNQIVTDHYINESNPTTLVSWLIYLFSNQYCLFDLIEKTLSL
jgi:hypothetical protein